MPPIRNDQVVFLYPFLIIALVQEEVEDLIEVKITEHGIQMHGHAGYHENGQDIVCSAVSAITCSLINSLHNLTDIKIRAETACGMTVIEWEELTDPAKLLVDSWFLGLTAINQEYNCITFV